MRTRDFHIEYDYFLSKLKNKENFALSRYGDGELEIMLGNNINLLSKGNGEFKFDKNNSEDLQKSRELLKAYQHSDDEYYIGIGCKCCVGESKFKSMKDLSKQPESNLTWANIFVNSNYRRQNEELIPTLKERECVLVSNKNSKIDGLPFELNNHFTVGRNAWIDNYELIDTIKSHIDNNEIKNTVFLISAGPLANLMTYNLWKFNKNNTYIDIGSIFDEYLKLKITRGYQLGRDTLNKKCVW